MLALALIGVLGAVALVAAAGRASATSAVNATKGTMMSGARKVLCLGDSLTAGGYWGSIALPGATVIGKGWPGQGVKAVVNAALPLVAKERPTDIVLLVGVNSVASKHGAARIKNDLTKAWQRLKASGARIWAVKLTPWFGYQFKATKYHPAGPVTDAMKATTREVNQWLQSVAGTPDGPDYVIDTSALGDADYCLLAANSYDGLHMSKRGYAALAGLVQAALATVAAPAAEVGADAITPQLQRALDAALAPLRARGLGPTALELDWDVVTLIYPDQLTEKTVAGELPDPVLHDGRRYRFTTRSAGAAVGAEVAPELPADLPPEVRALLAETIIPKLARNDALPAAVAYASDPANDQRKYVTLSFYTGFRKNKAEELLGFSYRARMYHVTLRFDLMPGVVAVGADVAPTITVPAWLAARVEAAVARLVEREAQPRRVTYDPATDVVTFWFYTDFRRRQAAAALPLDALRTQHDVKIAFAVITPEIEVGQVVGTAQSTPWTCGPAALRAVLAHHGIDVSEDDVATRAGNAPVIGCTPRGLVAAATELGCRADVFQAMSPAALAPLVARDLPVMIVVDSFTQPGKAGHWVVVTGVGADKITLMDPHTAGCWRTLAPSDLDARWWHREGGRVVRRLALLVTPEGRLAEPAVGVAPLVDCVARGAALARGARYHRDHVSQSDALSGEVKR